ncbi:MAG: DsbA family protein [Rhizobiaceae bacterium]
MIDRLSRRSLLLSAAVLPASMMLLAACGDGDEVAEEPKPDTPPTPPSAEGNAPPSQGSVDLAKLLEPGALPEKQVGKDDAKVTIVEYASMTCGHCANFHKNTYPVIKEKYIDSGQARLIMREFPFDPRATAGFMLARCANDKYFAMVDVLFKQQETWAFSENARDALLQIAKLAGFSQESFEACLTDQKLMTDVQSVRDRGAKEFGVEATPTFFINGSKYSGALTVEEMSAIIDGML